MSRTVVISNAYTFADTVRSCKTNVQIIVMNEDAIIEWCQDISTDAMWNGLQAFQVTVGTHFLASTNSQIIWLKYYTSDTKFRDVPVSYALGANTFIVPVDVDKGQDAPMAPLFSLNDKYAITVVANKRQQSGRSKYRRWSYSYSDASDTRLNEEWKMCKTCKVCVHESCEEENGIIDDDDQYACMDCL